MAAQPPPVALKGRPSACLANEFAPTKKASSVPASPRLLHDRLGNARRGFGVAGEFHGEAGAALGHGAHVGGVAEHLAQGRASFSMEFARYAEVPASIAEAIVKKSG